MGKVPKRPQVLTDLADEAEFSAEDSLDAALRFLDAAETTFEMLSQNPEIGRACDFRNPDAAGLRRWRIRGFDRHLVFYRSIHDGVDVVRVIHAARDIESLFEDPETEF